MKIYAAILFLILSTQSFADDDCLDTAISDTAIEECVSQRLARADSALASSYETALTKLDEIVSDGDKGAVEETA